MFVENCTVQKSKVSAATAHPETGPGGKAGGASAGSRAGGGGGGGGEIVSPVECSNCGASVGVMDENEVYHFFGVIPEGA